MFSDARIPPLSEGQLKGLTKKRWKQYYYASVSLFVLLHDPQFPRLDELTAGNPHWKLLQKLCDRYSRAWLKLNDGLEYGTVERRLYDIESDKLAK